MLRSEPWGRPSFFVTCQSDLNPLAAAKVR